MNYRYENKSFIIEKMEDEELIKIISQVGEKINFLIKLDFEQVDDLMKGLKYMKEFLKEKE